MAGNTSTYKIFHNGKMKYFAKVVPVKGFDISSFAFQNYLYNNFNSGLKICKPIKIVTEKANTIELVYEYLQEQEWHMTMSTASALGEYLAELHNFCFEKRREISLPDKTAVVAMGKWNEIEDSDDKKIALTIRKAIYENLKPYDRDQIRIPVHRDFKMHNIVFANGDYNLIDFDFAAIDNVGIEIASFIIDFFYTERNEQHVIEFIDAYKKASKLKINWDSVLNDYLIYMCVNTFPFYMRDKIGEVNFRKLYDERNGKLNFTYINKKFLYESLQR